MKQALLLSKKGFSSLEFGIGAMLLILLVVALVDLSRILVVYDNVSNSIDYAGRVISEQGGIGSAKPSSFQGSYVTSSQLYNQVKENFESIGVKEDDWTLSINGKTFYNGTAISPQPYNTEIRLEITYNYRWVFLNKLIPFEPTIQNTTSRLVLSNYYTRYNDISTNIGRSY